VLVYPVSLVLVVVMVIVSALFTPRQAAVGSGQALPDPPEG